MSPKNKKLLGVSDLKQKFSKKSIPEFLRTDKEVSEWLTNVFEWKESGEVFIGFSDIANELSEFTEKAITGDHVSRAYRKWKRTKRI